MKLPKSLHTLISKCSGLLAQEQDHHNPVKIITPGMPELLRSAAADGAVLLHNRVLPYPSGTKISVFGRTQLDWFCTGYGSGGDVNAPYLVGLLEGLTNCPELQVNAALAQVYRDWVEKHPADHGFWGNWPRSHPEMPLTADVVRQARESTEHALVAIGRSSGEDRENALEGGSFYLTEEETNMLRAVTAEFDNAVLLLNIGSLIDFSFLEEFLPRLGAVLIVWQGGMESGNAVADLLCGKVSPSGRLPDTVARSYEDYPSASCFGDRDANQYEEDIYVGYRWFETFARDKVLFPFGYGLSYTTFETSFVRDGFSWTATVTNTGTCSGKETVMLFAEKPCGALGNPSRELVDFAKTKCLAPGESETLTLTVEEYQLASYDDTGLTGHKSCYVLQPGTYRFYLGSNVRDAVPAGDDTVEQLRVVRELSEAAAPAHSFSLWAAQEQDGIRVPVRRSSGIRETSLKDRILENLPETIPYTGNRGWKLKDVQDGKITLDTFVAQLNNTELEAISRGAYIMGSPLGARGNAGVFGGVTKSLREKGVPPITTTDGPSGIRLYDSCSLVPIGTLFACTFDVELVSKVYAAVGGEMKQRGTDVLLAPGMNIHRSLLCGRNFEYFSEDPYLTGKMAAAVVRGVQSAGVSACPKHFACNNQEINRIHNNSILSERALREIYLKGFEICVKESNPRNLMTSYNKINGVWGHYHYDLVQTILRREWGYRGNVMTDWWMRYAPSPEFPQLQGNAYRVRAGVDVLMPGSVGMATGTRFPDGTLLKTLGKKDGITLGELQYCAKNVLRCAMKLKKL